MGEKRFDRMIEEIRRKHGTRKIITDYTNEGLKIRLRDPFGKLLGTIAQVEAWATKQRKQRKIK
jgi:hypothetical protein